VVGRLLEIGSFIRNNSAERKGEEEYQDCGDAGTARIQGQVEGVLQLFWC